MTDNNYAGTGMTFSDLNELSVHQRNEILVRALRELDERIAPLKEKRDQAEQWLRQYAFENHAGIIAAGDLEAKIDEKVRWEFDPEGLSQLLAFGVTQDEYDAVIRPTVEVNKSLLNKLAKRGGPVRSIIDQSSRRVVTGVKLTVRQVPHRLSNAPRVFDSPGDTGSLDLD